MTRKLEDEFDLPRLPDVNASISDPERELNKKKTPSPERVRAALDNADKISRALPQVKGLELHEGEMDRFADYAEAAFQDLMLLGQNVEARDASGILNVAVSMLKTAVIASNSKAEKKLDMIELMLRQRKLEMEESRLKFQKDKAAQLAAASAPGGAANPIPVVEGQVSASREDILAQFVRDAVDGGEDGGGPAKSG